MGRREVRDGGPEWKWKAQSRKSVVVLDWCRRVQRNTQNRSNQLICPHEIRWGWNPKRTGNTFLFYYLPYFVSPSQFLVFGCFTERRPQLQPYEKRVDSKDKVEINLSVLSVKACKIFFTSLPSSQGGGSLEYIEGASLFVDFMPIMLDS